MIQDKKAERKAKAVLECRNKYLKDLPIPLTREEEDICVLCLDTKYEREAREALIIHNLRLVVYAAEQYHKDTPDICGIDLDELISEGRYGLVKAANTYQACRFVRFSTYAYICIKNMIIEELRYFFKYNNLLKNIISIDDELLEQYMVSTEQEDPVFENVYMNMMKCKIGCSIEKLTRQEKTVLELRFGLGEEEKRHTQKCVAKRLGVSQSYVSRVEKNTLKSIKNSLDCGTIYVSKKQ